MSRPVDPAAVAVRAAADAATDLQRLAALAGACRACPPLAATRRHVVVGDLAPGRWLLLVGEAPGATEDDTGRPFVGRAGELLDRLLAEAGIDRAGVGVANVLKCRPPANRTPTRAEAGRCRGWLDRQLALADPAVVLTLGGTAAAWAFGPGRRLADLRGQAVHRDGRRWLATYHPSAAIRFGPNGAPLAALREDLRRVAGLGDGVPAVAG